MKHLVTIMVDGQPMEATIRLGEDATEDSDATGEVVDVAQTEEQVPDDVAFQELLEVLNEQNGA